MSRITTRQITDYIEKNIPSFHQKRLKNLEKLKLQNILKRKNPYLFKAKNILTAPELIQGILDAHLSSQEETTFGTFLEGLAIFVCSKTLGGKKSAAEGIDLEFEHNEVLYIVAIKSGPNWGNSGQIAKMKSDFKKTKKILGTNTAKRKIIAINGCCYGREPSEDKGEYLKLCGQSFWEFVSGEPEFYTSIIEPIGHQAKQRNEQFQTEYAKVVNRFTVEFIKKFCKDDGAILWKKLVRFNSSRAKPN